MHPPFFKRGDTTTAKSQTLAKLADTDATRSGSIAKLTGPPKTEPFAPSGVAVDDHDLHVGIVRHLGLDFSLGSALEQIGEARRLAGPARRARIERAVRYLDEELQHC